MTKALHQQDDRRSSLPVVRDEDESERLKLKLQYFGWIATPSAILLEIMGAQVPGLGLAAAAGVAAAYFSQELHYVLEPSLKMAGKLIGMGLANGKSSGRTMNRLASKEWWLGQDITQYADQQEDATDMADDEKGEEIDDEIDDDEGEDYPDEEYIPATRSFIFSQLLAQGFMPSRNKIYLARTPDGTPITCPVSSFVHIALAGATRHGKTSIIRQLLSQLIYANCDCVLIDPHFTQYDIEIDEDWTPFVPHLKVPPQTFCQYSEIEKWLEHAATRMLDSRRKRRATQQPVGKDLFIFIDEYPAITAEIPAVQGHVSKLLREGGKYKIHLVLASQDFQVKTLFKDVGGSIRDCLGTVFYVGGDKVSVDALLNKPSFYDDSVENSLGKGRIIVKCAPSIDQKILAQATTPYTDNKAIYALVGESTYTPPSASPLGGERHTDEIYADEIDLRGVESADRGSTSEPKSEPENEDSNPRTLPPGWTTEDIALATMIFKNLGNKDQTLKAIGKSQTTDNRRALTALLQEE